MERNTQTASSSPFNPQSPQIPKPTSPLRDLSKVHLLNVSSRNPKPKLITVDVAGCCESFDPTTHCWSSSKVWCLGRCSLSQFFNHTSLSRNEHNWNSLVSPWASIFDLRVLLVSCKWAKGYGYASKLKGLCFSEGTKNKFHSCIQQKCSKQVRMPLVKLHRPHRLPRLNPHQHLNCPWESTAVQQRVQPRQRSEVWVPQPVSSAQLVFLLPTSWSNSWKAPRSALWIQRNRLPNEEKSGSTKRFWLWPHLPCKKAFEVLHRCCHHRCCTSRMLQRNSLRPARKLYISPFTKRIVWTSWCMPFLTPSQTAPNSPAGSEIPWGASIAWGNRSIGLREAQAYTLHFSEKLSWLVGGFPKIRE